MSSSTHTSAVDIDLNKAPDENETLESKLCCAAYDGELQLVKELLSEGANVNAKDSHQRTVLHWAAAGGNREMILCLCDAGVEVEAADLYHWSPIYLASLHNNLETLTALLDKGARINRADVNQITPLHWACSQDSLRSAELLIRKGCDINARDLSGKTPLHHASAMGSGNCTLLLLRKNADLNAVDNDGLSALHQAEMCREFAILKLLCDYKADLNIQDRLGNTALNNACKSGNAEAVELLLRAGANPNTQDYINSKVPLHNAVSRGSLRIVSALLSHGADIQVVDKLHRTPLHYGGIGAVDKHDIVSALMRRGAKADAEDVNGVTALHIAAYSGAIQSITTLIEFGAEPSYCDLKGRNATHWAAGHGQTASLKLLLTLTKSDINCMDLQRRTPLDWAISENKPETSTFIRSVGGFQGWQLDRQAAIEIQAQMALRTKTNASAKAHMVFRAAGTIQKWWREVCNRMRGNAPTPRTNSDFDTSMVFVGDGEMDESMLKTKAQRQALQQTALHRRLEEVSQALTSDAQQTHEVVFSPIRSPIIKRIVPSRVPSRRPSMTPSPIKAAIEALHELDPVSRDHTNVEIGRERYMEESKRRQFETASQREVVREEERQRSQELIAQLKKEVEAATRAMQQKAFAVQSSHASSPRLKPDQRLIEQRMAEMIAPAPLKRLPIPISRSQSVAVFPSDRPVSTSGPVDATIQPQKRHSVIGSDGSSSSRVGALLPRKQFAADIPTVQIPSPPSSSRRLSKLHSAPFSLTRHETEMVNRLQQQQERRMSAVAARNVTPALAVPTLKLVAKLLAEICEEPNYDSSPSTERLRGQMKELRQARPSHSQLPLSGRRESVTRVPLELRAPLERAAGFISESSTSASRHFSQPRPAIKRSVSHGEALSMGAQSDRSAFPRKAVISVQQPWRDENII